MENRTVPQSLNVYAYTNPGVPSQQSQIDISSQTQFASFGRRYVAYWIDNLAIQSIISYMLLVLVLAFPINGSSPAQFVSLFSILNIGSIILWFVYAFLYLPISISLFGGTLGKHITGLSIVNAQTGKQISYVRALLRTTIGYFVAGVVLGLGYLWIAFDKKHQGWQDKIANTVVVKTNKSWKTGNIVLAILSLFLVNAVMIAILTVRLILPIIDMVQKSQMKQQDIQTKNTLEILNSLQNGNNASSQKELQDLLKQVQK